MQRSSRVIALALPVLWSCASDRVTAAEPPAESPADVAPVAQGASIVAAVEHTGAGFPKPVFPAFADLPVHSLLPDPFRFFDGSAVPLTLDGWSRKRSDLKASIENFEIGPKPDPSDVDVTATYTATNATAGTLRVVVTRKSNGRSLTLTSAIAVPAGATGAIPAVIGMNSPSGGLPADIFTSRNIARITYSHNNVTTYFGKSAANPYYQMYPEYSATGATGQYSAWSWGVSRLIDGLQIVASQPDSPLPIDVSHLAVTGCSYAGKMALFAGALDERIALTIAQESGGGGAPAWRMSHALEPNGWVEKTDNTDGNWFMQNLKSQFRADSVYKLPHDHHELMAMVAPRALLATGNTDFEWLSNEANYVTSRATHEVYKTLGVGDRFGFYIDGSHGHCAIPASQRPAIEAFVDKFLLGRDANTDIQVHPFGALDYGHWMPWADRGRTVQQITMDVQPGQISVGTTAVVNVVLFGAADFDAAAVDAANVRLVVNGGMNDQPPRESGRPAVIVPPVAPIMRGASANSSLADVNGDGRMDRIIGFSTSSLAAAGYLPGYHTLTLRPAGSTYAWQAHDVTGNAVTRPTVVP